MGQIWCRGKYWDTNTYNKKLSKENKIDYEYDRKIEALEKQINELEAEQAKKIDEVWNS